jgi:peptidoglycan/LPS O-acetylase OafA/YrhL
MTTENDHFTPLDGLRGIAIIAVILTPAYGHNGTGFLARVLNSCARSGWVGVTLFFVLSGFPITGILLVEILRARADDIADAGSAP